MELSTERLRIIPLNLTQFKALLEGLQKVEQILQLSHSSDSWPPEMLTAMKGLYLEAVNHQEDYLWYTNWQIVSKIEDCSVGSLCFMGKPNKNGNVEIGYGLDEGFRGKGYMTEAVRAMIGWALSRKAVSTVTALTDKDNPASHKVLERAGLKLVSETPEGQLWKIGKN